MDVCTREGAGEADEGKTQDREGLELMHNSSCSVKKCETGVYGAVSEAF